MPRRFPLREGLLLGLLLLVPAAPTPAQEEDEGGCVFNREIFPEGAERCQDGTLVRCEEGAWADIGLCDADAPPPPRSGGGDVEAEPQTQATPDPW